MPFRGDKVSILNHTYPLKSPRKIKVTICKHQADSPLCVAWCLICKFTRRKKYVHTWHQMSLLRLGVNKQPKPNQTFPQCFHLTIMCQAELSCTSLSPCSFFAVMFAHPRWSSLSQCFHLAIIFQPCNNVLTLPHVLLVTMSLSVLLISSPCSNFVTAICS